MQTLRPAFTLVELLLVIAVIAVLLAIALPAMQSARGTARQAACNSNLRQIGIGLIAYRDANKGLVPLALGGPTGDGRALALNTLAPFGGWAVTSAQQPTELLVCPDDPARAAKTGSSYEYLLAPLLFMALAQEQDRAALVVSRFVEQRPRELVFRDELAFHGQGKVFLVLRMDGSAGPFDPTSP